VYGEIHAWMYGAVELKYSCCSKWPNGLAIPTLKLDLYVGSTRFRARFWVPIAIPGTVLDHVRGGNIIDQGEALTLLDGNRVLDEVTIIHVDSWAGIRIRAARCCIVTGNNDYRQKAEESK